MDLTPSQLSSLNEMGIPVWALRSEESQQDIEPSIEISSFGCECLILVESHSNDQQVQRLLQALLFSIGLTTNKYTTISAAQLPQLQKLADQPSLLLVLGERFAQSLWGASVVRGKPHEPLNVQLATVVSFSLDEMLISPEKKALVWQDLQLAKQILDAI